jgi:hypothetical protein
LPKDAVLQEVHSSQGRVNPVRLLPLDWIKV